jgi:hypothetical protein
MKSALLIALHASECCFNLGLYSCKFHLWRLAYNQLGSSVANHSNFRFPVPIQM